MGMVFTWGEVRDGRIPRLSSFSDVIAVLQTETVKESSIVGAIACGSVIRGDHNIRSDIDCFVLYDAELQDAAFHYMRRMTRYAAGFHVPLGFIPCDTYIGGTRLHHIGASFQRHLKKSVAAGGLIKGHPLGSIVFSVSELEELESYLRLKMYNLQESLAHIDTYSEERVAGYLRKLLEAPIHVARKILAYQEELAGDSKASVKQRYKKIMPENMASQLDKLCANDASYTEMLTRAMQQPNESYYRELLHTLCATSGSVLHFIRSNLAFIANTAR